MTASLLQLVAIGSEDYIICGNPQITFWKNVYLKHTNFSFERLEILPKTPSKYNYDSYTEVVFNINSNYGDMLGNLYFYIELPDIYSQYPYKFNWIDNIGNFIIQNAYLIINNDIIEKIDSNLINIINTDTQNSKNIVIRKDLIDIPVLSESYKFSSQNEFTNVPNMCSINKINIHNSSIPSFPSKKLFIKIPFFFSKNQVKLPLNALNNSDIKIKLELRSLRELFYIGKPETIIVKKNSYDTFDIQDSNTFNKLEYYRYYAPKELKEVTIETHLKEQTYFNNINIGLIANIYFLDKKENNFFIDNKQSILINTSKIYHTVTSEINPSIIIEDNNLVKEIILVPQRNDADERNEWNYYGVNDYNINELNLKFTSNYYLKLCHDQYNSDINFINSFNLNSKTQINDVLSKDKFKIIVNYTNDSGNHICLSFDETQQDKYQYYINRTEGESDDILSPLFYYGSFLNNRGYNIIKVDVNNFRYKMYNKYKNSTSTTALKNVPKVYSDYNNLYIYFDELITTNSILTEPIFVKQEDCITIKDIYTILNIWNRRYFKDIPFIDDTNYSYFYKDNIVKELDFKIKGNSIINTLNKNNIYNSHLFTNYANNKNIENIVRYSFAKNPLDYQPSGHLDFENIDRLYIDIENKDIKKNDPSTDGKFKFNIYLSTINILVINDNKIKLMIDN